MTDNRVAVITCAVLEIELAHFAREFPQVVRLEVLEQGLHNEPDKLRRELQVAIDRVEADSDANVIVLGYGLCCRGTEGVRTRRCRLVIARAHDCITHLLGSKEQYAAYVAAHPGTYWYSPGWNKYGKTPGPDRYKNLRQLYAEQFGDDNADYLVETEQAWMKNYTRAAFVHLGAGDIAGEWKHTQDCAAWLGWECDFQAGNPALLRDMLSGPWDNDRFLVLNPGETFRMTADERVIEKNNPT
jgi:hypothetical protein